jgi:hypothetical protein
MGRALRQVQALPQDESARLLPADSTGELPHANDERQG